MTLNPTLIRSQIDYWFENSKKVSSSWYEDTSLYLKELANQYNLPIRFVAATFSALSPQQRFEQNKKNLEHYLKTGHVKHTSRQARKIEMMKEILEQISESEQDIYFMKILGGDKTKNFFHNLVYPKTSPCPTLDVWMIKGLVDWNKRTLTKKQYKTVSEIFIQKSLEYKIPVTILQSKIWIKIRNHGKN